MGGVKKPLLLAPLGSQFIACSGTNFKRQPRVVQIYGMGGSQCRDSCDRRPVGVNGSLPREPSFLPARACGDACPSLGEAEEGHRRGFWTQPWSWVTHCSFPARATSRGCLIVHACSVFPGRRQSMGTRAMPQNLLQVKNNPVAFP